MPVRVQQIHEIRPRLSDEFDPGPFAARTPEIAEAYRWGKALHGDQVRLSGEPYFETHCAWVGAFLDRLAQNDAWTIAGLLHDAVEDQDGSLEEIRNKFPGPLGEEVMSLVDGVTKISNPRDGSSREIETLRKIAMFRNPGVFIVKLADKSHNLMTLQHMRESKRREKAVEAIRAYGKLAGIMNCYRWRRWIEDMAFPYAEPETYRRVKPMIDADPRLQVTFLQQMLNQLGDIMERAGLSGEVNILVNGYWRAWQKLRSLARAQRSSLNSFGAVSDMVSFRMVLDDLDESKAYALLAAVNRHFGSFLEPSKFIDYIAHPQNCYRAIHIAVWIRGYGLVEIAITNADMEGENMWGVIYALQNGKNINNYRPIEIFTPSGSARFLSEGATVLDAVASIQQEYLLDKISAVEVNGEQARLNDLVRPGDMVEVLTTGQRVPPTEEWLSFSSASTRVLVQNVLATESLRRTAEEGQERMKTVLCEKGILTLEDVRALEPVRWDILLEHLGCVTLEHLYAAFGGGAVQPHEIKEALEGLRLTKANLGWTSIQLAGPVNSNKPGVLTRMTGIVTSVGGDIIRTVTNTHHDGSYSIRLVVRGLTPEKEQTLRDVYNASGIPLIQMEIV